MRILIEYASLFLVPFIAWVLWGRFEHWRAGLVLKDRPLPWLPLAALGLVLVGGTLAAEGLMGGTPSGGQYIPAHLVDGQLVPGTVATPGQKTP